MKYFKDKTILKLLLKGQSQGIMSYATALTDKERKHNIF
jgi:hypothetical protein